MDTTELEPRLRELRCCYGAYATALGSRIKGAERCLERLFIAFLCGGNVLLEGAPGLGKTSLAKAWSEYLGLAFSRIQFTPDLMPLDIIGSNLLEEGPEGRRFRFYKGPIFANVVLGDEINRATPKTQSAFLEAMEEGRISFLGEAYELPRPFMVLATQNPIELEGTYPLPEAQLDRFFMRLSFSMPAMNELLAIMELADREAPALGRLSVDPARLRSLWAELSRIYPAPDGLRPYVARIIEETHPDRSSSALVRRYARYGASPRAALALEAAAKARAALRGAPNASYDDVDELLDEVCAHRVITSFDADADGVGSEAVLAEALGAASREFSRPAAPSRSGEEGRL